MSPEDKQKLDDFAAITKQLGYGSLKEKNFLEELHRSFSADDNASRNAYIRQKGAYYSIEPEKVEHIIALLFDQ